jgi:hypothetical protein
MFFIVLWVTVSFAHHTVGITKTISNHSRQTFNTPTNQCDDFTLLLRRYKKII